MQTLISVAHLLYLHGNLSRGSGRHHKARLSPPSNNNFFQFSDKSSHIKPSMSFRMSLRCQSLAQTFPTPH